MARRFATATHLIEETTPVSAMAAVPTLSACPGRDRAVAAVLPEGLLFRLGLLSL